MIRFAICLLLLGGSELTAVAQDAEVPPDWFFVRGKLDVPKNERVTPAQLTAAWTDGERAMLIRGGIEVKLPSPATVALGPFAELQYNTTPGKEEETLRLGVSADGTVFDLVGYEPPLDRSPFDVTYRAETGYRMDGVKEVDTFTLKALLSPVWVKDYHPGARTAIGSGYLTYNLSSGVEWDRIVDAPDDSASVARLRAGASVVVGWKVLGLLEEAGIRATATHRFDVASSAPISDDSHGLFEAGIDLFPLSRNGYKAGISLTYSNGEAPDAGFVDREEVRVSVSLLLNPGG